MIYCVQGGIITEIRTLHRYICTPDGPTIMSKHPANSVVGICEGSQSNNVVWFMHLFMSPSLELSHFHQPVPIL